jgi:hypothetical protein
MIDAITKMKEGGRMPLAEQIACRFTYQEYLDWNDDQRWELIDGPSLEYDAGPDFQTPAAGRSFLCNSSGVTAGQKICAP